LDFHKSASPFPILLFHKLNFIKQQFRILVKRVKKIILEIGVFIKIEENQNKTNQTIQSLPHNIQNTKTAMSTIIIRLQNLPLSAKAADIREFFGDLKIPKGSVNIVGGQHGDAFIGFASDEDARLAMLLDGRLLHNSKIHLMLSSRREMEQVITNAQAHALNLGTMPAAIKQETKEQQSAAPGFNGLQQIKKEPKLEGLSHFVFIKNILKKLVINLGFFA
jgi:hypothetical protein